MTAYYNEIEPFAVAWLRELIREGVIADGIVDDRSIEVVEPKDLNGFTQCHFFAGIGVWSYALRRAGWPDDRPVWTGSCPCQPFSAAGKEEGFADPRHLWPSWFRLAREHRPVTIFGEQVERAIRNHWLDLVSTDLEAEGYAVGPAVFGAHSVGAPNRRQRVYFVADASSDRIRTARPGSVTSASRETEEGKKQRERLRDDAREHGATRGLSDPDGRRREQHGRPEPTSVGSRGEAVGGTAHYRDAGVVSDTDSGRRRVVGDASRSGGSGHPDSGFELGGIHDAEAVGRTDRPSVGRRDNERERERENSGQSLALDARLALGTWLTPSANEDAAGNPGAEMQPMLGSQAKLGKYPSLTNGESRETSGSSSVDQLPRQASLADSGTAPSGSNAPTAKRAQLNPALSRWLMGLPRVWDVCAVTAMQLMPKRRSRSSKRTAK